MRPSVLFAVAALLNAAYLVFNLWVSTAWRDDLERDLGPVADWLVPTMLAYVPGVVIGFFLFTLLLSTYVEQPLVVAGGVWPDVTVVIAAWNAETAIAETIAAIARAGYRGRLEVVLADNNSTDRTAELAEAAAHEQQLEYRRVFEPEPGKHHALNALSER